MTLAVAVRQYSWYPDFAIMEPVVPHMPRATQGFLWTAAANYKIHRHAKTRTRSFCRLRAKFASTHHADIRTSNLSIERQYRCPSRNIPYQWSADP